MKTIDIIYYFASGGLCGIILNLINLSLSDFDFWAFLLLFSIANSIIYNHIRNNEKPNL